MKKIISIMLLTMLFVIACGEKKESATSGNEKGQVIKVGLESTYPPFEYKEDGQLKGFDIDLMNELGKALGFQVKFIEQPFDGLIPALKSGKIDLVAAGMSATEERKKSVDFSDTYYKSPQIYLRKKGNDVVSTKESLDGKNIGVQLGTIQETTAKQIKGAKVVPNESTVTLLMNLDAGKLDTVILDGIVASEYIKKYTNIESFIEEPSEGNGMGIAANKGKKTELLEKINAELKKMKEDGRYKALLDKYGLPEPQM